MLQALHKSLAEWMTCGGDARIVLDRNTGMNRYLSTPFPREVLALASSTANDISADAYAHLAERFPVGVEHLQVGAIYANLLDELREDIRGAYALDEDVDVWACAVRVSTFAVGPLPGPLLLPPAAVPAATPGRQSTGVSMRKATTSSGQPGSPSGEPTRTASGRWSARVQR